MKRFATVLAIVLALIVAGNASADILTGKITDVVSSNDKNGNPYVRIIVLTDREESGVKYSIGVAAMVFSSAPNGKALIAKAKSLKAGDKLDARASKSMYNGRLSYVVHAFAK
jgi:hypothetical protein